MPDDARSRATIIAAVDCPAEVRLAGDWIDAARDRLSEVSDQRGCGCCVLIWEVVGPADLIASIPETIRCADTTPPAPRHRRLARLFGRRPA